MTLPKTLGELKSIRLQAAEPMKDEMRDNVVRMLRPAKSCFRASSAMRRRSSRALSTRILSKHDFILLGLPRTGKDADPPRPHPVPGRAAARHRRDGDQRRPFAPVSRKGGSSLQVRGRHPMEWLSRDARYREKLATPGRDHRGPDWRHRPDQGSDEKLESACSRSYLRRLRH